MKIEESEKKYGKRWGDWTNDEVVEHVGKMTMEDLNIPLNIRYAMTHFAHLSASMQEEIRAIRSDLEKVSHK